ncbi:calcium-binding protein 39-like [Panicum miliaceum]|uniref:Calcium-binding protein 39-like n=1 Tax=Panicum miliaceum TaxID=4540 RepID=A0A3L6QRF6_PANMI|nr:calcium-binding protein 39-like [Panicum miliaceum]
MSFFFRGGSRQRPTPQEIVRSIKDSLVALDNKTGTKALDDAEKNILTLRHTLSGDGEVEPNQEQVLQIALEICKEGVLSLFVQNLPSLGWEGRKDLVHCWSILLRQKVDESYCCVQYIENHVDLLDFLVVCYKNLEIALNCGNMLRECIKYPTLAKYILESSSFELFFQYVELPNFDIASDALNTFKDLLTKHEDAVSEFLSSHYEQFFGLYTRLLSSTNYVTRRQSVKFLSEFLLEAPNAQIMKRYILEVHYLNIMIGLLKDSSKNIRICAFHIFKVFVANPNKPREIVQVLVDNHRELLKLLHNLPTSKGEDEQLDEERDLIIKEIEKLVRLSV